MHHRTSAVVARIVLLIAASTALALTACSGSNAAPPVSPSAKPTLTPSPRPKKPSAAKPTRSVTTTSTKPQAQPVKLAPATGVGPAGSLRTTGNSTVALTFDDGPDPVYTPKILDLLKKNRVKATFCVVGFRARDHPDLIRRIAAEGHTLCNHSWQHLMDLGQRSDSYILKDLKSTNAAIRNAAPRARIRYFRAPGGYFTVRLVALAKSLGMKSIYWTVDTRDWDFASYPHGTPMVNHIIYAVKSGTRPGAIVLSHDLNKPDTVTAYAILLPWLKPRFRLVALPT